MLRHLQRAWRTLPTTSNITHSMTPTSTSTASVCPSCTRSFANEAKAIPTHTPSPEAANPARPCSAAPSTSTSTSSSRSSSPSPSPDTLPLYLRDHTLFSTLVNDINIKNEQYDSAAAIAASNTLGGSRQDEYHVRKLQFDQQVRAFRKKYRDEYQERFRIAQTKAATQAKEIKAASRARIFAKEESNRVVHLKGQVYMLKRKQKQQQVAIQKHKNRLVYEAQRRNQHSYQLSYLRWERTQYWIRDMDQDLHPGIFEQELVLPGWWPSKPTSPAGPQQSTGTATSASAPAASS